MFNELKPAILITIVFTILTGILYPLAVTGVAQLAFPHQANGSLVPGNNQYVGSTLIAQNFTKAEYFHPRPSAASDKGYDPTSTSASNLGPSNPALADRLKKDAAAFRKDNPDYTGPIPADAITTSGSGLDPEISPANALAQSARVAHARNLSPERLTQLVDSHTQGRQFGFLGEPRVNVLELNLDLDRVAPLPASTAIPASTAAPASTAIPASTAAPASGAAPASTAAPTSTAAPASGAAPAAPAPVK